MPKDKELQIRIAGQSDNIKSFESRQAQGSEICVAQLIVSDMMLDIGLQVMGMPRMHVRPLSEAFAMFMQ